MSLPPLVFQILLIAMVAVAAFFDLRFRRIPNWLVLAGLILGIGLNAFLGDPHATSFFSWSGTLFSLKGLGLAFLIYFPLYLLRGMGAGDVKLMAAVGAIVGWRDWLGIFIITALLGGLVAIALLLSRGRLNKTLSNVGSLVLALFSFRAPYARNEELDITSGKSVKLPHGVVIAWGCLFFLAAAWLWAPK